jgi:hypothetical protein
LRNNEKKEIFCGNNFFIYTTIPLSPIINFLEQPNYSAL